MLHAPDFLGYDGAIEMARDHRGIVERGLRMKQAGNELMRVVGGRSVHPVNVRVGGFYRAPSREGAAAAARPRSRSRARRRSRRVRWTATLDFPELERDVTLVSLLPDGEDYPIECGRIVSSGGLDIAVDRFPEEFVEEQVPHSTALHARMRDGGRYLVGPMARFANAFDRLTPEAREAALAAGAEPGTRNQFRSIVVRSVEILYACEEALRLIDSYEPPDPPAVAGRPARRRRPRRERGAPRHPLPALRDRRRGDDPRRADHAADGAEPGGDRGRHDARRRRPARAAGRRAARRVRAGHPQLRPVHLVRDALPRSAGRSWLTARRR